MHAVILGGSSDIGIQIARRLVRDEWRLNVTYRGRKPTEIEETAPMPHGCSVGYWQWDARSLSIPRITEDWDLLISCIGSMEPIGLFAELKTSPMETMGVNLLWPLRGIFTLLKYRRANASIVFFSGMNTNGARPNFFAYSIAKLATIKAMELLDAELPDCKCFALGPGYIPSKMHEQIRRAGLEPKPTLKGASHDDVYDCLMWAHKQPKEVIGGRNIAVHTDDWKDPHFATMLAANPDLYKLRRATR